MWMKKESRMARLTFSEEDRAALKREPEASRRIEEATGIKRGLTQVRKFVKKVWV